VIKPYYQDNYCTQFAGHVLNVLLELEPESVQCVVTSPPYWGLRDYGLEPQIWDDPGGCEHEWGNQYLGDTRTCNQEQKRWAHNPHPNDQIPPHVKVSQGVFCLHCNAWRGSLGLEPTPELYIQHLVQVFREVRRVLRKDGTVFLNLGDSYASQPASTGISFRRDRAAVVPRGRNLDGLKPKDLCMIPARVALALQADGWWLRSDIIWAKPNPMPESVTDRPTTSHEHVFLLTKSQKYFYDQDAAREKNSQGSIERFGLTEGIGQTKKWNTSQNKRDGRTDGTKGTEGFRDHVPIGRNLRSVWTIATQPFPKAHFATFPEKLVETCIKAGTSQKGCCPECRAPWVRVVEKAIKPHPNRWSKIPNAPGNYEIDKGCYQNKGTSDSLGMAIESKTLGWKVSCHCIGKEAITTDGKRKRFAFDPIPCTVLDPFSGRGTVLVVAKRMFRKSIGIDLKAEYHEMSAGELREGVLVFNATTGT